MFSHGLPHLRSLAESHGACGIEAGAQWSSLFVGMHVFMRPGGTDDEIQGEETRERACRRESMMRIVVVAPGGALLGGFPVCCLFVAERALVVALVWLAVGLVGVRAVRGVGHVRDASHGLARTLRMRLAFVFDTAVFTCRRWWAHAAWRRAHSARQPCGGRASRDGGRASRARLVAVFWDSTRVLLVSFLLAGFAFWRAVCGGHSFRVAGCVLRARREAAAGVSLALLVPLV